MADILRIADNFALLGKAVSAETYGCGHINDTYLVITDDNKKYILQKVNNNVFKNVEKLMDNIIAVTTYLRKNSNCESLNLIPLKTGGMYLKEDGKYYRVYDFIENAVTYQTVGNPKDFYYSGVAFGRFQKLLDKFPAETLYEVIPNFHNTKSRYIDFEKAVAEDKCGRAKNVEVEISFARARKNDASLLVDMLGRDELPLRVTHNDTKLNNVMLDVNTGLPRCVIDLDTVMPGLSLYDYGDSIRFGTNPAAEDEKDLDKVYCDLNLFEQYSRGFLEECGGMLTENEIKMLPFSAKMMTYECGIRFLADHLAGDVYFKIHRENHNLDRCRTQFKLVADMEKKMDEMNDIIRKIIK